MAGDSTRLIGWIRGDRVGSWGAGAAISVASGGAVTAICRPQRGQSIGLPDIFVGTLIAAPHSGQVVEKGKELPRGSGRLAAD
jgi:hypothetical protein